MQSHSPFFIDLQRFQIHMSLSVYYGVGETRSDVHWPPAVSHSQKQECEESQYHSVAHIHGMKREEQLSR